MTYYTNSLYLSDWCYEDEKKKRFPDDDTDWDEEDLENDWDEV